MNHKEFIEKNLLLDGNVHLCDLFNHSLLYFLHKGTANNTVIYFYYKNVFNNNINCSLHLYENAIITFSKDSDPFFSSNFDELNINSLQELCLFCEKLLKNKIFL